MKKIITLKLLAGALVALLSVTIASAQDTDDSKTPHFGFKIGINTSGFTSGVGAFDRNSPGYSSGPFSNAIGEPYFDVNAGITVDYPISKSVSFATELLYNGRGGSYDIEREDVIITDTDGTQSDGHDHYAYQLGYMELPVMLQFNLGSDDDNNSYRFYVGVSPAIRVSANTAYTHYVLADDSVTENKDIDVAKVNYSSGFSLNPIMGFWMSSADLGHGLKLFGDIRFEYTFANVFEREEVDDENLQTSMWTVNFGFGIRF